MMGRFKGQQRDSVEKITKMYVFFGMLLLCWRFPLSKLSLCASPQDAEGLDIVSDMGSASFKTFGALILILGVILLVFYMLRRLQIGPMSLNRYRQMRLMGTLSLGPKRSVALVEICGQWLVLGVGSETVNLLFRFDEVPEVFSQESVSSENGKGFRAILHRAITGNTQSKVQGGVEHDHI
jgi:flagellar biosynthetic protein FliO